VQRRGTARFTLPIVRCRTFEGADCDRFQFRPEKAGALAEPFMLADSPADGRKWAPLLNRVERSLEIKLRNPVNEARYVDVKRACLNAFRVDAMQAPEGSRSA
jgi:hypothetical protein